MSNEKYSPLNGKPACTTHHAHVANVCLPTGHCPYKTPIFISGFSDARSFLSWLRASCPDGLTTQIKGEMMYVPSAPDGNDGVSLHTFTLPENRCVQLLVKDLDRGTPESVVREELESLSFRIKGFMQLRSKRRDQDPATDSPLTPHFIISVPRGSEVLKVRSLTEICGLRISAELYVSPSGPLQCKRCQRFGHTQRNCGYAPVCFVYEGSHLFGGCSTPREQLQCFGCGRNQTANYHGCVRWKEAKASLAKQEPERSQKSVATDQPAAPKALRAGPSAEQMDLVKGSIRVVRCRRVVKAITTSSTKPHPNPPSQLVTESQVQPIVSATRDKVRPKKSDSKSTVAPKRAAGNSKRNRRECQNRDRHTHNTQPRGPLLTFVLPTRGNFWSRNLHLQACVDVTFWLLTSISTLHTARPWALLKTVTLFVA